MKRREFIGRSAASALALYVTACQRAEGLPSSKSKGKPVTKTKPSEARTSATPGFGPLEDRRGGILDLPKGFEYVVIQQQGDLFSDGVVVPHQPDGMACFINAAGQYVLLRNHELGDGGFIQKFTKGAGQPKVPQGPTYNPKYFGGVARLVIDKNQLSSDFKRGRDAKSTAVTHSQFVLFGTDRNCAGGVYKDGWITCEESSEDGHGYAFLTRIDDEGLQKPRRLDSWGRFHREAVVVDETTGISYMTEDRYDGLFYRHVPNDPKKPLGQGRLQALKIDGVKTTDPYPEPKTGVSPKSIWKENQSWEASWVTIPDPQAAKDPCRDQGMALGATQFMRGEGIAWDGKSVWFCASLGGPQKAGQIFEYQAHATNPDQGRLTLRYEVTDRSVLSCPDNAFIAPWGGLLLAEDNYARAEGCTHQYIRGLDDKGRVYDIARNRHSPKKGKRAGAEFTGLCFSPDGQYLFVNLQAPISATLAIRGPWSSYQKA